MCVSMGMRATVIQYSINVSTRKKEEGRTKLEQEQIWNGFKMFPAPPPCSSHSRFALPRQPRHFRLLSFPLFVAVISIAVAMIVGDYDRIQALNERGLDTHLRRIGGGLPVRHDGNGRRWGGGEGGGGPQQGE